MAALKPFTFICGQDDFLVGRLGRERFEALAAEVTDEFGREIIGGFAANVDEVAQAVNRFRESIQTLPMFGGRRVVWLKDVNFLGEGATGKAESTVPLVEDLQQVLAQVNPAETAVLVTAAPVDRRRVFLKWCEKNADFVLVGGGEDGAADGLAAVVLAEARALGATFGPGAIELLLTKVGANTRLLVEEVRKLATYADGAPITEAEVTDLSPNAAESDFFETAEAFFSGDLRWMLGALRRHFFSGGDGRPVIAALQNRNRLLLQMRALVDAGEARLGPRGIEGVAGAAGAHRERFAEAAAEKSSYNLFAQNPWYLSKLAGAGKLPSVRRLIDNQQDFIATFLEITRRPREQQEVLREMAVRCMAG